MCLGVLDIQYGVDQIRLLCAGHIVPGQGGKWLEAKCRVIWY